MKGRSPGSECLTVMPIVIPRTRADSESLRHPYNPKMSQGLATSNTSLYVCLLSAMQFRGLCGDQPPLHLAPSLLHLLPVSEAGRHLGRSALVNKPLSNP